MARRSNRVAMRGMRNHWAGVRSWRFGLSIEKSPDYQSWEPVIHTSNKNCILNIDRTYPGEMPLRRSDRRRSNSSTVSSRIEITTNMVATLKIAGLICSRMPFHI